MDPNKPSTGLYIKVLLNMYLRENVHLHMLCFFFTLCMHRLAPTKTKSPESLSPKMVFFNTECIYFLPPFSLVFKRLFNVTVNTGRRNLSGHV